jgi:rhomboid domain-containing protein 1
MLKGKHLENKLGSSKFVLLLGLFTVSTGITYVGLNYLIGEVLEDSAYLNRCAVGFSGVIFALKVLTTHDLGNREVPFSFMGIPLGSSVSAKYTVWVELILISLVTPNASFVGHLAGILVGLAYVYGPLKFILDSVHGSKLTCLIDTTCHVHMRTNVRLLFSSQL